MQFIEATFQPLVLVFTVSNLFLMGLLVKRPEVVAGLKNPKILLLIFLWGWVLGSAIGLLIARALPLGVLLEPTTVVTKAWEQVVTVGQRAFWEPQTVLVTGAGPIGLLAALIGAQRGMDVHVLARADHAWLEKLLTRREGPEQFDRALQREADDIKVVVQFGEA